MHFNLSEEQLQLSQSLTRLLSDCYSFEQRRAIAASAEGWSEDIWRKLAELGITALGIPEDFGGVGGGAVDRLAVMQAFGRALLIEPYLASSVLAATAVRECGTGAALLLDMASGELRLAWAHDEADARHAPLWVETRARRDGERWLLDGNKSLVLHAAAATRFVVSARVQGAPSDADGLGLFLVEARHVHVRPYRLIDDTPAGELILNGTVADLLSADSHAYSAIRATLAAGTAAVCADMLGTMETAFELTKSYVNTRKQFGRLIGEYQTLRHRVAEIAVGLEMTRSMAIAAAVAADDQSAPGAATDLSRAKLVIGRHARTLCQTAIQLHGGIGMTEEYAVGHCLRRIHVLDHLFGDAQSQATRLAEIEAASR